MLPLYNTTVAARQGVYVNDRRMTRPSCPVPRSAPCPVVAAQGSMLPLYNTTMAARLGVYVNDRRMTRPSWSVSMSVEMAFPRGITRAESIANKLVRCMLAMGVPST